MEKRYYWFKLYADFFESKRIKKLRKMKRGDTLLVVYLKMQLKSLCTGGVLVYSGIEDSFADELALDLNERPEDVRNTLAFLLEHGLCECDDTNYTLPWVAVNTGSETASTQRSRDCRNRKRVALQQERNADATQAQRIGNAEKEIEKEIESDNKRRFTPPTVEQVWEYCTERGNNVDPQTFVDFYEAKGWMVGSNHMKDWRACVRTWEKNRVDRGRGKQNPALKYEQKPISKTDFDALVVNFEEEDK